MVSVGVLLGRTQMPAATLQAMSPQGCWWEKVRRIDMSAVAREGYYDAANWLHNSPATQAVNSS